ncbi:MAG: hypothetical protein UT61_C0025G0003 [Candidatus Woesebacteria bacterium GW2011_GWA1_39_8]|uniref:Uncharacterized protein n=1 Tax=Candidatus Woesebacteria bacterium GW2011_GWA1_39_8 TaxID=1618552 RepID=A0A0G0PX34_9BACT|nr:MAG: hypothetical protein UT61_C0025G0003 [Candidatus Woesebacteria bacterium GW2011_GWA1_39_8]
MPTPEQMSEINAVAKMLKQTLTDIFNNIANKAGVPVEKVRVCIRAIKDGEKLVSYSYYVGSFRDFAENNAKEIKINPIHYLNTKFDVTGTIGLMEMFIPEIANAKAQECNCKKEALELVVDNKFGGYFFINGKPVTDSAGKPQNIEIFGAINI